MRFGLIILILLTACQTPNDESRLNDLTIQFDRLIRDKSFDYKQTLDLLNNIDYELSNSVSASSSENHCKTFLTTKWNLDSTIVFLRSKKEFAKGFKKEIILNYNDTTIFTYCWRTDPSMDENDYSFIESFSYCKPSQPIKYVTRVDYDHKTLSDTLDFMKKPFVDLSGSAQSNLYDFQIDYAKSILLYN